MKMALQDYRKTAQELTLALIQVGKIHSHRDVAMAYTSIALAVAKVEHAGIVHLTNEERVNALEALVRSYEGTT